MKLNSLTDISLAQLNRAVALKKRIASLESQLAELLGGLGGTRRRQVGRPPLSANGRASSVTRGKQKRRKMSAKARARMAAAAKARWARAKAAGRNSL
jgi:hypothetical protein